MRFEEKQKSDINRFSWVETLCVDMGMQWFGWVWKDFGRKFYCEFGSCAGNIYTGLLLRKADRDVITKNSKRWIKKQIKRILKQQKNG